MTPFSKNTNVGFVGVGSMGLPMSLWLRQRGWRLHAYTRREEQMLPLVSAGAFRAQSLVELGSVSKLVLLCLSDDEAVEQVLFGPGGIEKGITPGSVVVDMSTIAADSARNFAKRLEKRGVTFLDAPISGGQKGAEAGTLACMVGGRENVVDAVREVLGAFCKSITHVGDVGAGQTVKACNQVAAACALLGVAEAIAIAQSQGVDVDLMRQVLLSGTARSFVLEKDGQRIIDKNFEPGFRARLMRKDLRIALDTARGKAALVATPLAESLLDEFCEAGGGEMDWSAMGLLSQRHNVG
jgi:2-hydroxy-3-oxopropionate reductase